MRKFRLKKDLPFAKAGDMVEMWSDGTIAFTNHPDFPRFNKKDVRMFPLWFEEVDKKKFGIDAVSAKVIEVSEKFYTDSGIDNLNKLGAWFDTEEEAEKYLEYRKAKTTIKQDTNGFNPDWSNKQQYKYYGYWDLREHKPIWNASNIAKTVNIYFESRKLLEESFEKHSKEWKTYLTYEQ